MKEERILNSMFMFVAGLCVGLALASYFYL